MMKEREKLGNAKAQRWFYMREGFKAQGFYR